MGISVTGTQIITVDDRGVKKTNLMFKNEDGENRFFPILVGFKKGVEIKNKTRIEIKNGFLTAFEVKNQDEQGNASTRQIMKLVILDFDVVEEGTDTPTKSYQTKKAEYASKKANKPSANIFGDDDDLPF